MQKGEVISQYKLRCENDIIQNLLIWHQKFELSYKFS